MAELPAEEALTLGILQKLQKEYSKRLLGFGTSDARFELWHFILENIHEIQSHFPFPLATDIPQAALAIQMRSSAARFLQSFNSSTPLPLHRQSQLIFVIKNELEKAEVFADPFISSLLSAILQNVHTVPVQVLLVIARFYSRFRKYEETLEVLYTALDRIQDQDTPVSLEIRHLIGRIACNQKRHDEALVVFRSVVAGRERLLGKEHHDTMLSMENLAFVLGNLGKHREAEAIFRKVFNYKKASFGLSDPGRLKSMFSLAVSLKEMERYWEAEALLRQCVELQERYCGKTNPEAISGTLCFAETLSMLKRLSECERLLRYRLPIYEEKLGKYHAAIFYTKYLLAKTLF